MSEYSWADRNGREEWRWLHPSTCCPVFHQSLKKDTEIEIKKQTTNNFLHPRSVYVWTYDPVFKQVFLANQTKPFRTLTSIYVRNYDNQHLIMWE